MLANIQNLHKKIENCMLINNIDLLPNKNIRISTNFQYFDGTFVDLFIQNDDSIFKNESDNFVLTDFGSTFTLLHNMNFEPLRNPRKKFFIDETIRQYSVKLDGWDIELDVNIDNFVAGVINISQACMQIADLAFTKQFSSLNTFNDKVEDVISEDFNYEKNKTIILEENNTIKYDFWVEYKEKTSAIFTYATGNRHYSIARANHIVRNWRDVLDYRRTENRITIFDDSVDVYRPKDLSDIEKLSTLLPFSEYNELPQILR